MSDEAKDPPIKPQNYLGGVRVVDFGEARIQRGLTRRPQSTCEHHSLLYDDRERRIWCSDCETTVEAFDAFSILVENHIATTKHFDRMREEAKAASEHVFHLIAARNVEKAWRGRTMAIDCPHCSRGLLPEDFYHSVGRQRSAEIERQRRKNEKKEETK